MTQVNSGQIDVDPHDLLGTVIGYATVDTPIVLSRNPLCTLALKATKPYMRFVLENNMDTAHLDATTIEQMKTWPVSVCVESLNSFGSGGPLWLAALGKNLGVVWTDQDIATFQKTVSNHWRSHKRALWDVYQPGYSEGGVPGVWSREFWDRDPWATTEDLDSEGWSVQERKDFAFKTFRPPCPEEALTHKKLEVPSFDGQTPMDPFNPDVRVIRQTRNILYEVMPVNAPEGTRCVRVALARNIKGTSGRQILAVMDDCALLDRPQNILRLAATSSVFWLTHDQPLNPLIDTRESMGDWSAWPVWDAMAALGKLWGSKEARIVTDATKIIDGGFRLKYRIDPVMVHLNRGQPCMHLTAGDNTLFIPGGAEMETFPALVATCGAEAFNMYKDGPRQYTARKRVMSRERESR